MQGSSSLADPRLPSPSPPPHDGHVNVHGRKRLQPPQSRPMFIQWKSNDLKTACSISRGAALGRWKAAHSTITTALTDQDRHHPAPAAHKLQRGDRSHSIDHHVNGDVANVFLVDTSIFESRRVFESWILEGDQREWGTLMIDFAESTREERMEFLEAAANFHGGALIKLQVFRGRSNHYHGAVPGCGTIILKEQGCRSRHHQSASPTAELQILRLGRFETTYEEQLSRQAVASVVDALSKTGLPFLELMGLSDQDPAIEAQLQKNQQLFELGDLERVPATSIRLFICGDPHAGKTTLLNTLHSTDGAPIPATKIRRNCFVTCCWCSDSSATDYNNSVLERTQGIEVRAITSNGIRISLWDMAGQQEFHAFHDYMFPDIATASSNQAPSLFMFVWSPIQNDPQYSSKRIPKTGKEFEESFRYWLKFLASKSRKSNTALKVIVVFTHADQLRIIKASVIQELKSLRNKFKKIIDILVDHTFEVDARNKKSVEGVEKYIFEIAGRMLQDAEVYGICTEVNNKLLDHARESKEKIISWSQFKETCMGELIPYNLGDDPEAKLHAIAWSLNESGNIIYVNSIGHIILDPNWFCNKILGSLIYFPEGNESSTTMIIKGIANRDFLEQKLELVTKHTCKGSSLVDLMEGMHLCCKVPCKEEGQDHLGQQDEDDVGEEDPELYFVPATLTEQSQLGFGWRMSHGNADTDFMYMGRRLVCENKALNFLTPGLFPRIQVLFSGAFEAAGGADVKLGKDFVSIFVLKVVEIIVVFCQANADHVIDVLVRVAHRNLGQENVARALANVQEHIIDTLIKVCAQPKGIQGATLIEHAIRPECLHDPSQAGRRSEDQCVEMNRLKRLLKECLQKGLPRNYGWKTSGGGDFQMSPTTSFRDLLGHKNYSEVETAFKASLENNEDATVSDQSPFHQSASMHRSMQHNRQPQEVEVVLTAYMANEVYGESLRLDEYRKESKEAQTELSKFLTTSASEQEASVPRLVLLRTEGVHKLWDLLTLLSGRNVIPVHLELCCEYHESPHRVEKQPGMSFTSLSPPLRDHLETALPYINGVLLALTAAARVALISSTGLPVGCFLPEIRLPTSIKAAHEHPLIAGGIRDGNASSSAAAYNTSQRYREWQKCFKSILAEYSNHGRGKTESIEQAIGKRFLLFPREYRAPDGSNQVAWLCSEHYRE